MIGIAIGSAILSVSLALVGQQGAVDEGKDLLKQQKFEEARQKFEAVLATSPDDRDALVGMGRALLGLGDLDKAQATLEKVLSKNPKDPDATLCLGLTALAHADRLREGAPAGSPGSLIRSRYNDAARWLAEVTTAQPNNIEAWNELGRAKLWLDDLSGAAQAWERALAVSPNDVTANFRLGDLYCRYQVDYKKAMPYLQSVLRAVPDHVDARRDLGHALLGLGRTADAVTEYRRVLKMHPADDGTWQTLWDLYAAKGKYDEARRLYRGMLDEDPKNAMAQYQLAFVSFTEKKYAEAIEGFKKALEMNPKYDAVERLMGDCYLAQSDFPNAAQHYLAAIQLNPENQEAHDGLAGLAQELGKQKRYADALDIFTKAIAVRPKDPLLHANLALTYKEMGKTEEAIQSYEKAIEMGPADAETLNDLALLYEGKRQFNKATDTYKKAIAVDANNLDARENLAVLDMKFGNLQKAIDGFREVLKKDPKRERSTVLYSECRRLMIEGSLQK